MMGSSRSLNASVRKHIRNPCNILTEAEEFNFKVKRKSILNNDCCYAQIANNKNTTNKRFKEDECSESKKSELQTD